MVKKKLENVDTSNDYKVFNQMSSNISGAFKNLIAKAKESGMIKEIDKELKSDPDFQKAFEKFNEELDMGGNNKSVKKMKSQLSNITEMFLSMEIDPDIETRSAESYDFPYERVNPELLRRAGNSMAAQMIKHYRSHQLVEFTLPSDGKRPGFKLAFQDEERKIKDAERKKINEVEKILSEQFFFVPNEQQPNFAKWIIFAYNDFFDIDKLAIEIVRQTASGNEKFKYRGIPLGFKIVDGGSVYHVVPKRVEDGVNKYRWDFADYERVQREAGVRTYYPDDIRYIQVDKNLQKRTGYLEDKMILSHAFGTTDIRFQFQGHSIVEKSLQIIRYIVDSVVYNATRRSTGTMPKGMITVEGATEDGFSREEMAIFRKLIWGISSGHRDKWKYPILGTPKGVKTDFIKFHESSKEMEDFIWMSTLFTVMGAFAGLEPEALSLASQKSTIGKQRLFDKKEEEGVTARSQDEGLRFFLGYLAAIINKSGIVEEITGIEGLEFMWVGLDVEDEEKKVDLEKKKLETTASVNDLLTAQDKPKATLMVGDINIYDLPASGNQQLLQLINTALQNSMEPEEENPDDPFGVFAGEEAPKNGADIIGDLPEEGKILNNKTEKSIRAEVIVN